MPATTYDPDTIRNLAQAFEDAIGENVIDVQTLGPDATPTEGYSVDGYPRLGLHPFSDEGDLVWEVRVDGDDVTTIGWAFDGRDEHRAALAVLDHLTLWPNRR